MNVFYLPPEEASKLLTFEEKMDLLGGGPSTPHENPVEAIRELQRRMLRVGLDDDAAGDDSTEVDGERESQHDWIPPWWKRVLLNALDWLYEWSLRRRG